MDPLHIIQRLPFRAFVFAERAHRGQLRRYTGEPYIVHCGEVAMTTARYVIDDWSDIAVAVAWLHDVREDCNVADDELCEEFGREVANGVHLLSDLESGNRALRKRLSRERLSTAPGWVQTIKCADLLSNLPSIVTYDRAFAPLYLREAQLLLEVLTSADRSLHHAVSAAITSYAEHYSALMPT